jgi:hypothetical protein
MAAKLTRLTQKIEIQLRLVEDSCTIYIAPGKEPLVPIGQEAGWAPEPFWSQWGREKFPAPAGDQTLEPRSSSP